MLRSHENGKIGKEITAIDECPTYFDTEACMYACNTTICYNDDDTNLIISIFKESQELKKNGPETDRSGPAAVVGAVTITVATVE